MLADELDCVVGVDTHRDEQALVAVAAPAGAVVARQVAPANTRGYRQALRFAKRFAPGRRAWAIEGTGSYGAGLARFLASRGETVLELSRIPRAASATCAVRTTRSTAHGQRGQHSPARRSRCREQANDARRYGCFLVARRSAVDVPGV